MNPEPLYRAGCADPAYQLRYAWTGWLRGDPSGMPDWETLAPLWERDGLRLLEHRSCGREVQVVFSARPDISPVVITARAKGRLQHAWRESSPGFPGFTRTVALRSVGKNARNEIEAYIARLAVMTDHVHVAIRGDINQSPQDIALCFQNNLASTGASPVAAFFKVPELEVRLPFRRQHPSGGRHSRSPDRAS